MMIQSLMLCSIIASYLIGAIPTGFLFARYFFNIDITQHGSGNIGATNIGRVFGGVRYFVLIFLIDAGKAFFCLCIIQYLLQGILVQQDINNLLLLAGMALLLGNAHSIFLRFKGGKGVATTLGIIAYLIPLQLIIFFIGSWLLIMVVTRQAFIASIGAVLILNMMYVKRFYAHDNFLMYFLFAILLWIVWRHKSNIINFLG